jgi:3-phenylpropionate/trans-cinnamate dioxygenase ferredoxin reductase subunit
MREIVVVGASAAGLTAAETLRREGFAGRITIIGNEAHLPYDRPPMSKQVLAGDWPAERATLRPAAMLDALNADWRLKEHAIGLDTANQVIELARGGRVRYDGLVITTGARARTLASAAGLGGVCTLRTVDDALALSVQLARVDKLVVIGAGVLGCEVAASARRLGKEVTVVEPLAVPLFRQFGMWLGELIGQLHRRHGVRLLTGVGVAGFESIDGSVSGVVLDNGECLAARLVLLAVGSSPNVEWLVGSGLEIGDGVLCDETLLAAPGVVAAGDVANWPHRAFGRRLRLEHRTNAGEQGIAAARRLRAAVPAFAPMPYFWTDQYDVKLQAYGLPSASAEVELAAGDPADGRFALRYVEAGRLQAGVAWNMPRHARALRQQIVDELFNAETAAET